MRLLIDTNIVLELLLEQARADEVQALLVRSDGHEFFVSDYSLHSIGILLFRRKQHQVFRQFLDEMIIHGGITVISLPAEGMGSLLEAAQGFDLDFDDAY